MLSVKQGSIKNNFLCLCYDLTGDWTPVFRTIGEHSTHWRQYTFMKIYTLCLFTKGSKCCKCVCVCVCVWKRERERERERERLRDEETKDCYIWPHIFLIHVVFLYSEPYLIRLLLLYRGWGLGHPFSRHSLIAPFLGLKLCHIIFIKPTYSSSGSQLTRPVSAVTCPYSCIVFTKFLTDGSVKGQYVT